jgi:circadian clock protein KaiB
MNEKGPGGTPERLRLRLYVAGASPNSVQARSNLRAALEASAQTEVNLEVVDVLVHPERGLQDCILVTPTLIRLAPAPEQRVIGNLHDRDALLAGLGIVGSTNRD